MSAACVAEACEGAEGGVRADLEGGEDVGVGRGLALLRREQGLPERLRLLLVLEPERGDALRTVDAAFVDWVCQLGLSVGFVSARSVGAPAAVRSVGRGAPRSGARIGLGVEHGVLRGVERSLGLPPPRAAQSGGLTALGGQKAVF